MGELLLATTTGPGGFEKQVAIKRLHPEMVGNPSVVKMFLDEARICAGLRHPNIIEIYDLGEGPDGAYIVMEYLDGHDLRGLLKRVIAEHRRIPVEIAVHIIQAVCRGLHHAHERTDSAGAPLHIVHRDVSPQNVFLTFEGQVKVIDFGIAKANGRLGETRTGTIKGKFGYMSPEQARGRSVDRRSDIFCAGVLLFELSTTSKLFRGNDEYELLQAVVEGRYIRPSAVVDGYLPELERIVMRSLAVDPNERHATAMILHDELEALSRREGWRVSPVDLARYLASVFASSDAETAAASSPPLRIPSYEQLEVSGKSPEPSPAMRSPVPTRETVTLAGIRRAQSPSVRPRPNKRRRAGWLAAAVVMVGCIAGTIAWSSRDTRSASAETAPAAVATPARANEPTGKAADAPSVAKDAPAQAPSGTAATATSAAATPTVVVAKPAVAPTRKAHGHKQELGRRVDAGPTKEAGPETVPAASTAPEPAVVPSKTQPCASKWEPC